MTTAQGQYTAFTFVGLSHVTKEHQQRLMDAADESQIAEVLPAEPDIE